MVSKTWQKTHVVSVWVSCSVWESRWNQWRKDEFGPRGRVRNAVTEGVRCSSVLGSATTTEVVLSHNI